MSQPIQPWASTKYYPVVGRAWDNTLTKVNPAYSYFTPGSTPSAQELNYMFNARDLALNAVGAIGAEVAVANFGPVSSGQTDGVHTYFTYAAFYDHSVGEWKAALDNTTPAPAIYASQDGRAFVLCSTIAALPNASVRPKAISGYPGSGTVMMYGDTGANGIITRCTQGLAPTSVGTTNNAWAIRGGALCNQGVMAFFWGANTPGIYFFGASSFGARAAWNGFAAFDSVANDGNAGGTGVWTDLHTSLPASFASGNSFIFKYETAQSATTLVVAQCGLTTGTDRSFLMAIDVTGAMTDITPASIGLSRSIRGVAYSTTDALWGMISVDSGGTSYFDVSADLSTWTNVLTIGSPFVALAVIRNTWAMVLSESVATSADRCFYLSNVADVLNGATPLVHLSAYPPLGPTAGSIAFQLQSNEVPGIAGADAFPRSPQLLGAFLNVNCAFTQSLRAGHVTSQMSGPTPTPAPSPGWNTALDIDFSKLLSATYAGDGSHTIDGLTWTKAGSANERVVLTNTLGAGLTFAPLTGTGGCSLYLPFTQFMPANALLWSTGFRIWLYMQAQNLAVAGDSMGELIYALSAPTALYAAALGITGGHGVISTEAIVGSALAQANMTGMPGAPTNVLVLETPGLGSDIARSLAGQYNSGQWPTEALSLFEVASADGDTQVWQDPTGGATFAPANCGILLSAAAGATANLAVTIGRIRVDFKL